MLTHESVECPVNDNMAHAEAPNDDDDDDQDEDHPPGFHSPRIQDIDVQRQEMANKEEDKENPPETTQKKRKIEVSSPAT